MEYDVILVAVSTVELADSIKTDLTNSGIAEENYMEKTVAGILGYMTIKEKAVIATAFFRSLLHRRFLVRSLS